MSTLQKSCAPYKISSRTEAIINSVPLVSYKEWKVLHCQVRDDMLLVRQCSRPLYFGARLLVILYKDILCGEVYMLDEKYITCRECWAARCRYDNRFTSLWRCCYIVASHDARERKLLMTRQVIDAIKLHADSQRRHCTCATRYCCLHWIRVRHAPMHSPASCPRFWYNVASSPVMIFYNSLWQTSANCLKTFANLFFHNCSELRNVVPFIIRQRSCGDNQAPGGWPSNLKVAESDIYWISFLFRTRFSSFVLTTGPSCIVGINNVLTT